MGTQDKKRRPAGRLFKWQCLSRSGRFARAFAHHQRGALKKESNRRQCGQKREKPAEAVNESGNGDTGSYKKNENTRDHTGYLYAKHKLTT